MGGALCPLPPPSLPQAQEGLQKPFGWAITPLCSIQPSEAAPESLVLKIMLGPARVIADPQYCFPGGSSPDTFSTALGQHTRQLTAGARWAFGLPDKAAPSLFQDLYPNTCFDSNTFDPSQPARPLPRIWTSRAWAKLCISSGPLGDPEIVANCSCMRTRAGSRRKSLHPEQASSLDRH